jgi:hypothetical protein
MGNYNPILMQIGKKTKKNMLSLKVTTPEVSIKFQDGRRRHVGNSSECYKMGNYHRTLMKIGTQTRTDMLSSKVIKAEAYGKKTAKIKCKKQYRSLKSTYYATKLISSFYTCNKISMTLYRSLEYTHAPRHQVYKEIQTTIA